MYVKYLKAEATDMKQAVIIPIMLYNNLHKIVL